MPQKRIVAALTGDGHIVPIEQDAPALRPGAVLVAVRASLVSPGTELGGWRALLEQRKNPKPQKAPKPFGYSNAGVVAEAGEGVTEFKPGDRVACIGAGYAQHANLAVVPHNLCVRLPQNVTFAQGAYAMLSATALHAVRRGQPELGEFVAVVGLGLLGQLAAQFYRLACNYVIGWDMIAFRNEIARRCGIHATVTVGPEDPVALTRQFTGGFGLDAAVFAFGGDGNAAVKSLMQCLKVSPDTHTMGRVVVVGNPSFDWPLRAGANAEFRQAGRTGPGYHDDAWEVGPPYPPVFMRWTTRTNLELCMRLIAEGRLNVDALTTHTIPLTDVEAGIDAVIDRPDEMLGVVFEM
jgi:threonine dehydrogenase-like Zn-dependent dehydrogenase